MSRFDSIGSDCGTRETREEVGKQGGKREESNLYTSTAAAAKDILFKKQKNVRRQVHGGQRNVCFYLAKGVKRSPSRQPKSSRGSLPQPSQLTKRHHSERATTDSPLLLGYQILGHNYGDTYISSGGLCIQGNIHYTANPKTIIYADCKRRSSFETFLESLLGSAVGCSVVLAGTKAWQAGGEQKDAGDDSNSMTAGQETSTTGELAPAEVTCVAVPGSNTLISTSCSSSYLGSGVVPQLCMAERGPIAVHKRCNMVRKPARLTSWRPSVLVLKVETAQTSRYRLLVQQLERQNHVTIVTTLKETLAILQSSRKLPHAVVVYDGGILGAAMSGSSVARETVLSLADFTHNGGTTILGPECDLRAGYPYTFELLERVWQIRLQPAESCHTQFWVTPRLADYVAEALSYYFEPVRKRLLTASRRSQRMNSITRLTTTSTFFKTNGPRYRSASERYLFFVEHGNGKLGSLGRLGSGYDTSRMIASMVNCKAALTSQVGAQMIAALEK